jgi:hypothetical protein
VNDHFEYCGGFASFGITLARSGPQCHACRTNGEGMNTKTWIAAALLSTKHLVESTMNMAENESHENAN